MVVGRFHAVGVGEGPEGGPALEEVAREVAVDGVVAAIWPAVDWVPTSPTSARFGQPERRIGIVISSAIAGTVVTFQGLLIDFASSKGL